MSDRLYRIVSADEPRTTRGRRSGDKYFQIYAAAVALIVMVSLLITVAYLTWFVYRLEEKIDKVAAEQAHRTPFVYPKGYIPPHVHD